MSKKDQAPRKFSVPLKRIKKGLLIIYTGEGKGKSTAAFGAVFRALGRKMNVGVVQFIKGKWVSGEIKALESFGPQVEYFSEGEGFTWETQSLQKDIQIAKNGWKKCISLMKMGKYQLLIFDEILYVLKYNFLSIKEVCKALKMRNPNTHIILTGRDAPPQLLKMADLVTEMKEIKHPFQLGIAAQPGIDY